ncbi:hypothetical protein H4S14_000886 [Agrobacterium vitis]|nr:hypothetical protein [Agrobacterium vitis]MBE1437159.1 hypothetical protein [Agrobacterium vitis]
MEKGAEDYLLVQRSKHRLQPSLEKSPQKQKAGARRHERRECLGALDEVSLNRVFPLLYIK